MWAGGALAFIIGGVPVPNRCKSIQLMIYSLCVEHRQCLSVCLTDGFDYNDVNSSDGRGAH